MKVVACICNKVVDKGKFYGCTQYKGEKSCKFTLPKRWSEKTIRKMALKALITKDTMVKLKGFESKKMGNLVLILINRKGGEYNGK